MGLGPRASREGRLGASPTGLLAPPGVQGWALPHRVRGVSGRPTLWTESTGVHCSL